MTSHDTNTDQCVGLRILNRKKAAASCSVWCNEVRRMSHTETHNRTQHSFGTQRREIRCLL